MAVANSEREALSVDQDVFTVLRQPMADPERLSRGGRNPWRAREARAYNGGLGAEPPAGSRGRAPGGGSGGQSPPEAESFSVLRRRKKTANLPLSCVLGSGLA